LQDQNDTNVGVCEDPFTPHQGTPRAVTAIRLLWVRRRLLLKLSLAGLILGTLIAFLVPKKYQSSTRLMPPESKLANDLVTATTRGPGAMAEAMDLMPFQSTGALFIGILRSRTVEDHLIERLNLRKVYHAKLMLDARKKLQENTTITEDRRAGIITVTVTDENPQRAAAMASAYVEDLDQLVTRLNTSAAHRERVFIEGQLKQVKQNLDEASRQLSEFSSKNATLDIKGQGHAMVEAAVALQGQLIGAESDLRALQQVYTDDNVRVRAAKARIAELRAQLEKLGGTTPEPAGGSPPADQSLYPSLRKLPLLGFTYADLYRRTKIQETLYETLMKQYEKAKVEEAKEIPTVRVLDPPEVPERKTSPHRLVIMLVSTFLAFVLAAGWVLGGSSWSGVDPQDPTKALVQEILAEVKPRAAFWKGNGLFRSVDNANLWKRVHGRWRRGSQEDESKPQQ
jgi:capsule polysaccharide export protein KpsE/RkpR